LRRPPSDLPSVRGVGWRLEGGEREVGMGTQRAPVVDIAQGILDERLVLVVAPLAVDDEFVLMVPRGQVADYREHLRA